MVNVLLQGLQEEVERYARDYGLDFFPTIFEVVGYDQMNELAAYGGFPTRYPYWRFGMEHEFLQKGRTYGLQKIYEMVVNNNPCYAYLLEGNSLVDQKIVMAHVLAHCDFFKNNLWFAHTNRKMMDEMANHGTRIRRYMERFGEEEVENFIDACLSLEDLIDPHSSFIRRKAKTAAGLFPEEPEAIEAARFQSKSYMEGYINPPDILEKERERIKKGKETEMETTLRFPVEPEKDVLSFLIEHAPLENWQRETLSIIREESCYFIPQRQTKIMNEGWASYWHSKIMTEKLARDQDIVDYADHHAGVLGTSPGRINPYKLGIELFRDIEDRWDTGRFGKEYEECDDFEQKRRWDKNLGLGKQKIFEVRKIYNDIGFIDEFFTQEFCDEYKFFLYRLNAATGFYEVASRDADAVRRELLRRLTNFGRPSVLVTDGNYDNKGELLLLHQHDGIGLDMPYAHDTLKNVYAIWQRSVLLETRKGEKGEKKLIVHYDGQNFAEREA